jgi:hypothetical protein
MARKSLQNIYQKLLQLYPNEYRERFQESMIQTFNDLGKEAEASGKPKWAIYSFAFVDTLINIPKQYLLTMKNKILFSILGAIVIVLGVLAVTQVLNVEKAHATYANYYAFRGCTQQLEKTDTYGYCTTSSGQTIKMVLYDGKWYLDGDLPWCWGTFCF